MRIKCFGFTVLCLCVGLATSDGSYREYSIGTYCQTNSRHETIEMDDNEAVVIRSGDNYRNLMECSVSVKAEKGFGIIVTVKKINLRDKVDTLTIDVNDSLHPQWTGRKVVDNKESMSYVGDRKIQIRFSSGYTSQSTKHKEFILILTSYRIDKYCRQSEISCGQNRCLSQNFLCDGHNNCGDNSDEILCLDGQQTSNLAIVGSVLAGLVIVLLLCYCCRCFSCCCRSKKPSRKDYIRFSDGTTDRNKLETTFTEELEPSAPISANDHIIYGNSQSQFARFPVNPNYPYFSDPTNPRPTTSQTFHDYPPPPPYTPRDESKQ